MILSRQDIRSEDVVFPVCVVGAGPVGITLALALEERGIASLLVESGNERFSKDTQALSDLARYDPKRHAPMSDSTRRQLGGASVIWAGRCVPLEPIDFARRAVAGDAEWPISYEDIRPYYRKACAYSFCGSDMFELKDVLGSVQAGVVPGLSDGPDFRTRLERWSLPTNYWKEYRERIIHSGHIHLLRGATATSVECARDGASVSRIKVTFGPREETEVRARDFVLAAGGLETTRLLLASDSVHKEGIGNQGGKLGRYYMGHIFGKIAKVRFTTDPAKTIHKYEQDADNVYVRRRFALTDEAQQRHGLLNTVLWLDNPPFSDPAHGNAILSFAYLALTFPVIKRHLAPTAIRRSVLGSGNDDNRLRHLANCLSDLPRLIGFIFSFGTNRFLVRRKIPGLFPHSKSNVYELQYHAEQRPNPDSTVRLSAEKDAFGLPRLDIDFRYSDEDVDSVLTAHQLLDDWLRGEGVGNLEYARPDRRAAILEQAMDGYHQIGTTRMSARPEDGVVDRECRVHGVDNLYVCSSSVFPTSGHANPTLTAIALGIRLADHLQRTHSP